jgi:hypothetical protein
MTDDLEAMRAEADAELAAANPSPLARTNDDAFLERYVRTMGRYADEKARVSAGCDSIIADITRKEYIVRVCMEQRAMEIVRMRLTGKKRSVKTPWGSVGFTKILARVEVADAAELPDEYLRRVPDLSALVALYRKTGEIASGCREVEGGEKFGLKAQRQPKSTADAARNVDEDYPESEDTEEEERFR